MLPLRVGFSRALLGPVDYLQSTVHFYGIQPRCGTRETHKPRTIVDVDTIKTPAMAKLCYAAVLHLHYPPCP